MAISQYIFHEKEIHNSLIDTRTDQKPKLLCQQTSHNFDVDHREIK